MMDVLGRYGLERTLQPPLLYATLNVIFGTARAYKGLKADYLVIPRLVARMHGSPSEIVEHPLFGLVRSDASGFLHGDERRPFYIALTRARKSVTLVTVRGRESSIVARLITTGAIRESPPSTGAATVVYPTRGRGSLIRRTGTYGGFLGCLSSPAPRHTAEHLSDSYKGPL